MVHLSIFLLLGKKIDKLTNSKYLLYHITKMPKTTCVGCSLSVDVDLENVKSAVCGNCFKQRKKLNETVGMRMTSIAYEQFVHCRKCGTIEKGVHHVYHDDEVNSTFHDRYICKNCKESDETRYKFIPRDVKVDDNYMMFHFSIISL